MYILVLCVLILWIWWALLSEIDHFKDLGVVGSMILKSILKKQGWIGMAKCRDKSRILVNIAKNFRAQQDAGNFLVI
jgi:hypothetical protein